VQSLAASVLASRLNALLRDVDALTKKIESSARAVA